MRRTAARYCGSSASACRSGIRRRDRAVARYDPVAARNTLASINTLRNYYQKIRYLEELVKNITNNALHKKPIRMKWSKYTAKLYAYVQGQRHLIVPSEDSKPDFMWCNQRRGTTFAELGIDLKPDGTPLLTLFYRTNTYNF